MTRLVAIAATAILCTLALSVHSRPLQAVGNTATVNATVDLTDRRTISPNLFGIFFEEINHAGDGGLYAEMIKDRSFDAAAYLSVYLQSNKTVPREVPGKRPNQPLGERDFSPNAWATIGNAVFMVASDEPINPNNPIYAEVAVTSGRGGLVNTGYWGIPLTAGTEYYFSVYLALREGHVDKVMAELLLPGQGLGAAAPAGSVELQVPAAGNGWQKVVGRFRAGSSTSGAQLALTFEGPGILLVDMVSMFPADHIRADQMNPWPFRPDLLAALKALQPRFVRFPGGCYIEGNDFDGSFYWQKSVGSIDERPGHLNQVWRYWSADGLGLYEYMLLTEELGAEAVWVINNGVSHWQDVPTDQIAPWVDSALESIEFVTGPKESKWGSVRAAMGHPEPWALNYMAIGNEDCGHPMYVGNYLAFFKAIKDKYPHMKLIANCDLGSEAPVELWDYHEYRSADDMWAKLRGAFDGQLRSGPHIFASEYAVVASGWGTLQGAVSEAGFMVGMERNADVVEMGSYAPLLVNANWVTWLPDMIVFDNHRVYGIPSYWVQQMFAQHQGTHSLAVQASGCEDHVVVGASCRDDACSELVVKVINYEGSPKQVHVTLQGPAPSSSSGTSSSTAGHGVPLQASGSWLVLTSGSPSDGNSFESPLKVAPTKKQLALQAPEQGAFSVQVDPWSVNVLLLEAAQRPAVV